MVSPHPKYISAPYGGQASDLLVNDILARNMQCDARGRNAYA